MRIGVYQMKTSGSVSANHAKIMDAVQMAAGEHIRLLVFPECALCGYPPVETPSVGGIDFGRVGACMDVLKASAKQHDMYIAVGTVRKQNGYYNSMVLIGLEGGVAGVYDKRALWGWDIENFTVGTSDGVFDIDGVRVAFRICYEVRFPEYFREAFRAHAGLSFVSFCDVSDEDDPQRYELIKAHLATRACENVMTVVAVNSVSKYQTAPTAVFNEEGIVVSEAPRQAGHLLVYDYEKPETLGFGAKGRKLISEKLTGERAESGRCSI